MKTQIVQLETPIEIFGKTITTLTVKEPTGGLFLDIGAPTMRAQMRDGTVFLVEDKEAMKAYIERCVDHEAGGLVLAKLMSLPDAIKLKDAIMSFFYGGAVSSRPQTSETSSTDSSST